ncbi:Rha family transcriptional regulator [Escherichia coli]|uniref:Rha family transcriptional regulator n=1 Tax=Escherichia coli TaxID=562 RepID=UPI001FFF29E8|nr:Rha family transcriptional regulator [Escherichia coli]MCK3428343.1 Rha family transcriptional regulator [Escherichia coli]MCK3616422.1 Rha family transcriptional regulator [Escherichia coli]MCQ0140951.1 Rha family transcriptional regulator [Escherichia coli]HCS4529457.1 Rha family transcriptional regulator [Escherichia coli]HCS4665612.1 Rha family transcriptional regulator [Escherichia coli]
MNTVTTMNTAKTASVSLVVDNTKPLTMSSRQIAEFTDKKHSNVMRDIREMYESLGIIDQLKTEFVERINNLGYAVKEPVYHLDEEMTLTLVTGYDVKRRMIVIQEWKRLKEENEKLRQERLAVNPYADFEETDWIELALKKTRENKKLIELHVRKSVDSHSMTRLLGAKKGATKVKEALTALRTAGYIERVYDENNKPCGYVANDSSLSFCRMNAHYQLEFTVDVLPVLVELGILEEEQKATLKLPQPNNTILIQNKAAKQIRESGNVISLVDFGI